MTPTSMAVKAVYNALQSNQMLARVFISLFLLYPFVDNVYGKFQDAGLVPSLQMEMHEIVKENKIAIIAHSEIMQFQGERDLRLKLAQCINSAMTGAGGNAELEVKGVGLCVASLERTSRDDSQTFLPQEMSRMIQDLIRP